LRNRFGNFAELWVLNAFAHRDQYVFYNGRRNAPDLAPGAYFYQSGQNHRRLRVRRASSGWAVASFFLHFCPASLRRCPAPVYLAVAQTCRRGLPLGLARPRQPRAHEVGTKRPEPPGTPARGRTAGLRGASWPGAGRPAAPAARPRALFVSYRAVARLKCYQPLVNDNFISKSSASTGALDTDCPIKKKPQR
jgi:hypothetical protein